MRYLLKILCLLVALSNFSTIGAVEESLVRVVITGGPGCGKTSLIIALELLGHKVIRETAADYITLQQAKGYEYPWLESDFQGNLVSFQKKREEGLPSGSGVVFQDRSIIDSFAYWKLKGSRPSYELKKELDALDLKNRYFKRVFLIKDLGKSFQNKIRSESLEESRRISQALHDTYLSYGYDVIEIDAGEVDQRITTILFYMSYSDL